jgi:AcrR family transcriptional regulator
MQSRQPGRRTAARRVTLDAIVDAAAALIETEGFEALTMRRIAEECGVGVMTLYGYVRTKEEILGALSDRLLGEVDLPAPDGPWTEQVAEVFRSVHRVFSAHPELASIASTQPIDGLAAYRGAERVLAALRGAGFGDDEAFWAFDTLVCYTAGFSQREVAFEPAAPSGGDRLQRLHRLPPVREPPPRRALRRGPDADHRRPGPPPRATPQPRPPQLARPTRSSAGSGRPGS